MPFHSPNFALITPPTSMGGGGGDNAAGVCNGNLGDKQQQQAQQTHTFPMSFAAPNGATAPGFDICSMAYNPAILQSIPEAASWLICFVLFDLGFWDFRFLMIYQ